MKQCPACKTSYDDESLNFCLRDGTPLTPLNDQGDDIPTVVLQEQETVVQGGGRSTGARPFITPAGEQPGSAAGAGARPKRSNTFLVVLLTVFVMLFITALAAALWFYAEKRKYETVQNTEPAFSPSPKASVKPSAVNASNNSNASTPAAPAADLEQVKSDVKKKIFLWKSLSEARDLESNLENYADHVNYYRAKNATRDFIRDDKRKASSLYDSIQIDLTNLRIIPDPGGEKATAVFDKEWKFIGPGKFSAGKVQQQLQLEKIDEKWLITGEKDLKLYYKTN